jgi:serine/threonine protein kinase
LATGRVVALKILENKKITEYNLVKLIREIELLKRLNHRYVTGILDLIKPVHSLDISEDVCLVLEYLSKDLDKILKSTQWLNE